MKKYILLSLTLLLATGLQAQRKHKLTITKPDSQVITYIEGEDADSLRIIPGLGVKVYLVGQTVSIDYLFSQVSYTIEFVLPAIDPNNTNANRAVNDQGHGYLFGRLELPSVSLAEHDYFVQKSTSDNRINYTVEWCGEKRANRWTAYQLCSADMIKVAERKNKFYEDTEVPAEYRTTLSDYPGGGYARGHLCPSGDRVDTQERNDQTFCLSNMQPQISGHNSGIWNSLEGKVRQWAENCDTMYVVKAATIDSIAFIQGYITNHLIVPKYFYMALLAYKKATGTYEAMGIWSPHYNKSTPEYISIKELQDRTGIDFFCNLPDQVEQTVEQEAHGDYWGVTISTQVGVDPNEEFPPLPDGTEPVEEEP